MHLRQPCFLKLQEGHGLWMERAYALWNHCSLVRQHRGQRPPPGAWSQWAGSLWDWGDNKEREKRVLLRGKKKKRFKRDWQVSTHKVTGNTAREETSSSPPPKFTVWACKVIAGRETEKDHSSGLPEGSGCGPWSQAEYMLHTLDGEQNRTRHTHAPRWLRKA